MTLFIPSYDNYKKILKRIKRSNKYMDYCEAPNNSEFLILRHDIEFSIDRAYKMSKLETEEGISSTFFLQMTSNAYNPFSEKNLKLLQEMICAGHHIGLHYHLKENDTVSQTRDGIRDQIRIMSELLNYHIDRFSIHRPTEESNYYNIEIDSVINAYSKEYFTHVTSVDECTTLEIKYIADSKHRWNYGIPDEETIKLYPKIQLLIHPYSWSESGEDILHMFNTITSEKEYELLETFDFETKVFSDIKDKLVELRKIENGI